MTEVIGRDTLSLDYAIPVVRRRELGAEGVLLDDVLAGGVIPADAATGQEARTVAAMLAEMPISAVTMGLVGDGVEVLGAGGITSGTAALTIIGGALTSADIGKTIIVHGAGTSAAFLRTTISAVGSATTCTLAANASTTVTEADVIYGTLNSDTPLRAADALAYSTSRKLLFPKGIYLFLNPFSGLSEPYTPPRGSWTGDGQTRSRIVWVHSATPRTFRTYEYAARVRAQSRSQASPWNPVYTIDDIPGGQTWAKFTTTQDLIDAVAAGAVKVGDIFHVAGGKNEQDADDPQLWLYDQLHRIVKIEASNGKVFFEDAIDIRVTSGGWDGASAGKNLAATYANSTVYAAGTYVWDETAPTVLYVCTVAGTSNAATRAADTGCAWKQVTTALNALKTGDVDHRPVLQKAWNPTSDMVWSDLSLEVLSDTIGIDGKSFYKWQFDRVRFISRPYLVEATRYAKFNHCAHIRPIGANNIARAAIEAYNARKIECNSCTITGGGLGTPSGGNYIFRLESHTEITLNSCNVSFNDQTAGQGYCALVDRGTLNINGGQFLGFKDPFRFNTQGKLADEQVWQHVNTSGRPLIQLESLYFRAVNGNIAHSAYTEQCNYLVRSPYSSGGYVQADYWRFRPQFRAPLRFSFAPATNQTNTAYVITAAEAAAAGILDLDNCSLVVLGASAIWDTPGANDLVLTFQCVLVGTTTSRVLFSTTGASNILTLTSAAPKAKLYDSNGTGRRLVQAALERPRIVYTSGASAGGTCYVTLDCLVSNAEFV